MPWVAQVWDFMPVVRQFSIRRKRCLRVSPRAAAALEEATHTSRAALRPGTAAVVKRSACLDCVPVSLLGSVVMRWVRKFQSAKDGVDACIVSPSCFGGAAEFSVLKLGVQERST